MASGASHLREQQLASGCRPVLRNCGRRRERAHEVGEAVDVSAAVWTRRIFDAGIFERDAVLSYAKSATARVSRVVRIRDSHFVEVRVAGERTQERVIVFLSETPDVRGMQKILGHHFGRATY